MILIRLVGLLLDLFFAPFRAIRRARAVPEGAFLALTIDGAVADVVAKPRLWEIRARHATSLWALGRLVDAMIADPKVRGIVVTLKSLSSGIASASSLRAELARARAAGKEVVVHLPMGGGAKDVIVASAASKIFLGPTSQLAPLGFASTTRYVRRALDRVGVDAEIFHCGEYKSAGENLVRDGMSAPQREQLDQLLGGFHAALIDAIADGRGVTKERAAEIVDGAPYFGKAAIDVGLADGMAYEDEVPKAVGLESKAKLIGAAAYLALRERPLFRPLVRPPVVAVVPIHGTIAHVSGALGNLATDERVTRMIRVARLDRRVRGVILHIDTPGGSALASDRMHHEIAQLAREKPVVACMANVAASGGYYVAAPAHRIVCEATTVTGSIGVVAARFSLGTLFARLGIVTESVRRGARAGLLGGGEPLTDDERAALSRELDATYEAFLGVVAAGRKLPHDEVERLARGRVYTGKEALAAKLVDSLGGFAGAMREMRALLSASDRDRVEPRVLRLPRRFVPAPDPPDGAATAILGALLPQSERALLDLAVSGERVFFMWTGAVG